MSIFGGDLFIVSLFWLGSTSTLETGRAFSLDEDLVSSIQHLSTEVGIDFRLPGGFEIFFSPVIDSNTCLSTSDIRQSIKKKDC